MTGGHLRNECYYGLDNDYDDTDDMSTDIFAYDTLAQRWTESGHKLMLPREYHYCIKVGSQIIFVGGVNVEGEYCPMEAIHVKHIIPDWKWPKIKHYVLFRALIDQKWASPIIITKQFKHYKSNIKVGTFKVNTDVTILKLFTEIPSDIFVYVFAFMI